MVPAATRCEVEKFSFKMLYNLQLLLYLCFVAFLTCEHKHIYKIKPSKSNKILKVFRTKNLYLFI